MHHRARQDCGALGRIRQARRQADRGQRRSAGLGDAGVWALKQKGVTTLRVGTPGVKLDARLPRQPGDGLLVKKYASCFFGTDLVLRLVLRGVDTLLLAGCTTSGCVRATAVDACQSGFRPMVLQGCVGDCSQAAYRQSLFDLDAKYADVVDLADSVAYLRGLAR